MQTQNTQRQCLLGRLCAALLALLSSCGGETAPPADTPRCVKVYTVGKQSTGQSRRISGRVEAADESTLSFGVGGQVLEVIAKEGQTVAEGQLLARLDEEPFKLKLEEARANLNNARAKFVEAEAAFNRIKGLVDQRAASQKDLDGATAGLSTANGDVKSAQGALGRAELDLSRTHLTAPFPGKLVSVALDPFQEIAANGEALTLQAAGALEVDLLVPETMIRDVDFGQAVRVTFPTLEGVEILGLVAQIGAAAESGNAFPVSVRLSESAADLRPGMTASVTFNFTAYLDGRTAYLVPLSALAIEAALIADPLPDDESPGIEAPLFVFDPGVGEVKYRMVRVGNLRGNEVEVFEGLESGDQVVSAGVAFLRDGMKAEIWTPRR